MLLLALPIRFFFWRFIQVFNKLVVSCGKLSTPPPTQLMDVFFTSKRYRLTTGDMRWSDYPNSWWSDYPNILQEGGVITRTRGWSDYPNIKGVIHRQLWITFPSNRFICLLQKKIESAIIVFGRVGYLMFSLMCVGVVRLGLTCVLGYYESRPHQ